LRRDVRCVDGAVVCCRCTCLWSQRWRVSWTSITNGTITLAEPGIVYKSRCSVLFVTLQQKQLACL